MKDMVARLEKLLAEADECDLIGNLATDQNKRDAFKKLANQYREMAQALK